MGNAQPVSGQLENSHRVLKVVVNYRFSDIECIELETGKIVSKITREFVAQVLSKYNAKSIRDIIDNALDCVSEQDIEDDESGLRSVNKLVTSAAALADMFDEYSKISVELNMIIKTHGPTIVNAVELYLYFWEKNNSKQKRIYKSLALEQLTAMYNRLDKVQERVSALYCDTKPRNKKDVSLVRAFGRVLREVMSLMSYIISGEKSVTLFIRHVAFEVKEISEERIRRAQEKHLLNQLQKTNKELQSIREPLDKVMNAMQAQHGDEYNKYMLRRHYFSLKNILEKREIEIPPVEPVIESIYILEQQEEDQLKAEAEAAMEELKQKVSEEEAREIMDRSFPVAHQKLDIYAQGSSIIFSASCHN